jgi:hypothetical protein
MSVRQAAKSRSQKQSPKTKAKSVKVKKVRHEEDGPSAAPLDPDDLDTVPNVDDDSGKSGLKDDPVLDRRIIEGMLTDRKELLEQLAKDGMTSTQVLRRAAELGLSEALLRQVKGVAADLAGERPGRRPAPSSLGARTCLSCDRVFLSTGPGNRLCMRCRGGDAGLAQF